MRLDQALVARGLSATRSRARDSILRGTVVVNGRIAAKPGDPVAAGDRIAVDDPAASWVSRAALKLVHGLDHFLKTHSVSLLFCPVCSGFLSNCNSNSHAMSLRRA